MYNTSCFHTIQDDIDLKRPSECYERKWGFHTIQDDIDLKLKEELVLVCKSFHTIQDDIDLKPLLVVGFS